MAVFFCHQRRVLMDFKLELVAIPVTDVDRAKAFYVDGLGFNPDFDHQVNDELRFVQLTPPGSACSISIGTGITDADPGSVKGMQMTVNDIDAAAAELRARGSSRERSRTSAGAVSCSWLTQTATAGPSSRSRRGRRLSESEPGR
jgi:catechol 2,3-dioxygenase-like lactoylglutathione lyase family enzyme